MKIEFDPDDLKPEFRKLHAMSIKYEHLNDNARKVLDITGGRGLFYPWDRRTYNAVFVPTTPKEENNG